MKQVASRTVPPHDSPAPSRRPHGSNRFFVNSLKANRRLELWGIRCLNLWLELESDPQIVGLCERPLLIEADGKKIAVDFWVTGPGRNAYLLLSRTAPASSTDETATYPAFVAWARERGCTVEVVHQQVVTPARVNTYRNWTSVIQYVAMIRGLLKPGLMDALAARVDQSIMISSLIEEFAGEPAESVRLAVYEMALRGKVKFVDFEKELLSDSTRVTRE